MTNYEVLYIVSPKTEEGAREELIERFKNVVVSAGGSAEVNKWGMRKLAYKIGFVSEGYYVLMTFSAPEDLPAELERQMSIIDSGIRCRKRDKSRFIRIHRRTGTWVFLCTCFDRGGKDMHKHQ